jgi:hypothetical protein
MDEEPRFERRPVTHCYRCRVESQRYAYMQDGHHYCARCARRLPGTIGMRPVGRRDEDLKYF